MTRGGTVLYRNSTKRGAAVCFPPTTVGGPVVGGNHTTAPLLVLAGMPLLLGLMCTDIEYRCNSKQYQYICIKRGEQEEAAF